MPGQSAFRLSRFGHLFHRTVSGHWGSFDDPTVCGDLGQWLFLERAGACRLFRQSSALRPADFYKDLTQTDAVLDASAAQSMISGYRGNNGLGPVTIDPDLMRLANEQAQAMAAIGKLDHEVGRPFQDRIRNSGYAATVAVENISAGYHTIAEAFSGWRDSPPHRANMLNRDVTRMGIAAVYTPKSKYKLFWALILAAPDGHKG